MDSIEQKLLEIGKERRVLMETESKAILEQWGIPTVPCEVAAARKEALRLAYSIGIPVVLKILSPDIIHKTQAGGVRVNLATDKDVRSAFDQIMENVRKNSPSARILGATVQEMVSGMEVAVGVTKDAQFGHVLMFGMGGVELEHRRDTTFRLIPVGASDADEMIREIEGYRALIAYRGQGVDLDSLRSVLLKVSDLIVAYPEIEEMDLNPVIVSSSGSVVADARGMLASNSGWNPVKASVGSLQ